MRVVPKCVCLSNLPSSCMYVCVCVRTRFFIMSMFVFFCQQANSMPFCSDNVHFTMCSSSPETMY